MQIDQTKQMLQLEFRHRTAEQCYQSIESLSQMNGRTFTKINPSRRTNVVSFHSSFQSKEIESAEETKKIVLIST